jgi:hypothetical protein
VFGYILRSCRPLPWSVIALQSLVGGCVTTPEFDRVSGVTPQTIAKVIKCELIRARTDHVQLVGKDPATGIHTPNFPVWLAVAELTLTVDETATLTPSFTHTNIVSKTVSEAFSWGVKFDTQASRTYNQTITFRIDQLEPDPECAELRRGILLNGSLGLSEAVGMAFSAAQLKKFNDNWQFERKFAPSSEAKAAGGKGGAKGDYFGQTLDFAVIKNLNGLGPTWVLTFFKGPGGFGKVERGDEQKLTISFAPYERGSERSAESAAQAAVFNNTILLEHSLPANIINRVERRLQ